jgi:hypothetical protein
MPGISGVAQELLCSVELVNRLLLRRKMLFLGHKHLNSEFSTKPFQPSTYYPLNWVDDKLYSAIII